jgi:hypothetical protein
MMALALIYPEPKMGRPKSGIKYPTSDLDEYERVMLKHDATMAYAEAETIPACAGSGVAPRKAQPTGKVPPVGGIGLAGPRGLTLIQQPSQER